MNLIQNLGKIIFPHAHPFGYSHSRPGRAILLTRRGHPWYYIPYIYQDPPLDHPDIQPVFCHPASYNRVIPVRYFDREEHELYAFGPVPGREAILLFNEKTKLTEEKTVEYII